MQEEVENRTLTLVVNGTKFTGRLFKAAICKNGGLPRKNSRPRLWCLHC